MNRVTWGAFCASVEGGKNHRATEEPLYRRRNGDRQRDRSPRPAGVPGLPGQAGRSYHTTKGDGQSAHQKPAHLVSLLRGVGGDAITFLQRFCGKSFPEAVEYLLDYHGWARDSPALKSRCRPKARTDRRMSPRLPLPCHSPIRISGACLPIFKKGASRPR